VDRSKFFRERSVLPKIRQKKPIAENGEEDGGACSTGREEVRALPRIENTRRAGKEILLPEESNLLTLKTSWVFEMSYFSIHREKKGNGWGVTASSPAANGEGKKREDKKKKEKDSS